MNEEGVHRTGEPAQDLSSSACSARSRQPSAAKRHARRSATTSLLALLLLQPGRIVAADSLIDAIWASEPPEGAAPLFARTFRSCGQHLATRPRSTAPRPATRSRSPRLPSMPRNSTVSFASRTRLCVREASESPQSHLGNRPRMWRGRPFGDLAEDGPLRVEADRLGRAPAARHRNNGWKRTYARTSRRIVDEVEAAVAQYPYRERLWRLLMLALYHSGRQADALGRLSPRARHAR